MGTGAAAPAVGRSAADFNLVGLDGQTVSLKGLRGKVVVLNFWATWCPPCIAEMGNLEKSYQTHSNDGVVVVGVNQGEKPEDVKGFTEIYRLSFPMALDRQMQVGDLYRIRNLPTTIFIDRQGVITEIHVGGPMSGEFVEGRIAGLLRK
jgi:peroxiredoxin